jgi:hypothetical protein
METTSALLPLMSVLSSEKAVSSIINAGLHKGGTAIPIGNSL